MNDMTGPPTLSVLVPVRNAASTLREQLDALVAQSAPEPFEIVVVDNGSTDETPDIVREYAARHPHVRLVSAPEQPGVCYARNAGIRATTAPRIAICDGDDVVGPRWVAAMQRALAEHEYVTGPLELDRLNPPEVVESRGRSFASEAGSFHGVFRFAHGCNIGLRRATVERVGEFDDTQRDRSGDHSDVEMGMRMWEAGVALHVEPDALVHYRYRSDLRSLWRQAAGGARVAPWLNRRLREAGGPPPPRLAGLRNWAWLVRHVPDLRHPEQRARWVWVAAKRVGHLQGSLRHRTLYL